MKLLFLTLFLVFSSALAQGSVVNMNDLNMRLYQSAHTAASVVDTTGAYEKQLTNYGLQVDESCPSCNLHGSLTQNDENGNRISTPSSEATNPNNGQGP